MHLSDTLILIRGGGDIATGVAHRLHAAGFTVMVLELPQPLAVRRAVSFAEAVYAGHVTVEGVTARLAPDAITGMAFVVMGEIPVVVDERGVSISQLTPSILVDARLAKKKLDTQMTHAKLVLGLGPGFTAGADCHAVIETNRGHNLGRVFWNGSAEADTGVPEPVSGFADQRVIRAPRDGLFRAKMAIGDSVKAGDVLATVNGEPLLVQFDGVLRGLLHDGLMVVAGMKVGDLDPRGVRDYCFTISDKARAVGGGVLEAIFAGVRYWRKELPIDVRDRGLP